VLAAGVADLRESDPEEVADLLGKRRRHGALLLSGAARLASVWLAR